MRLIDLGLEKLNNLMLGMANLSKKTVETAIESYLKGENLINEIYSISEELRKLNEEVSDLAVEIIARYQPLASDLRFIRSCLEISYGFFRFGRYAYDIMLVLNEIGIPRKCDFKKLIIAKEIISEMMELSINSFIKKDIKMVKKVIELDDQIDKIYRTHMSGILRKKEENLECAIAMTLILRYMERIADHAQYIAESVNYIITGKRRS